MNSKRRTKEILDNMDINSILPIALQIIVALGLLNVWLIRIKKSTDYRGGQAQNLKDEFAAYGLPSWVFYVVGGLKILSAVALLAGLWLSSITYFAAIVVVLLMVGAIGMHVKIKDPFKKSIPAILMLVMSLTIVLTTSA
jgi:ABC-type multidrug transport system permease subunit